MKNILLCLVLLGHMSSGCSDEAALENKAREDADAKARADAAKKEMKSLPEAFKPRYNQKLDKSTDAPQEKPAEKKSP